MTLNQCWSRLCLAVLATPVLLACSGDESGGGAQQSVDTARVEGSVFYRERMMLPPGIEVEVQLQDISRPDAMATVLESVLLTPQGAPPYAFGIDYNRAAIDPRMTYALRATITHDGRLLFSSTDYIDPFAGNPVEILVQQVPETVPAEGQTP